MKEFHQRDLKETVGLMQSSFYKSLQRWVNMRAIFHKVKTFEEYDRGLAKE